MTETLVEVSDDGTEVVVTVSDTPNVVQVTNAAIGLVGPQGPSGSARLSYTQPSPAATWTWTHHQNSRPPVALFLDSTPGVQVYTDVTYPDLNTVVIAWPSPETGSAYI